MSTKGIQLATYCGRNLPVKIRLSDGYEAHCVVIEQIEGGDRFLCAPVDTLYSDVAGFSITRNTRLWIFASEVIMITEEFPAGATVTPRPGHDKASFNYEYPFAAAKNDPAPAG